MPRAIWTIEPRAKTSTTRERLMDAAAMRFYEHGFHAVGLDAIIEDAGVTKTTFYNHFASKDDLIVAVLEDRDRRDMIALDEELDRRGGDGAARILSVFDVIIDWFDDPGFKGCLFINAAAQFPNPNDPVHRAATMHSDNLYRVFVRLATEAGAADPEALAKQLGMVVVAAITSRHSGGDPEAAHTARAMAITLLASSIPHG